MPIAARFHELRDRIVASVDLKMAEPVRLSPMKDGIKDPVREQLEIEAVLRTGKPKGYGLDGGDKMSWRTRIASGKAELHIDRAVYSDIDMKKGDVIRALSRPGEPVFEVMFIDARNHTRLILELGEK